MPISKGLVFLASVGVMLMAFAACDKEPYKVDINDGNELPPPTKLNIEVTHQYSNYNDSLLPNVAVALYETEDDEQMKRHYRKDTTGVQGTVVLNNIKPGNFLIVLEHEGHGTLRSTLNVPGGTIEGWEYYRYR